MTQLFATTLLNACLVCRGATAVHSCNSGTAGFGRHKRAYGMVLFQCRLYKKRWQAQIILLPKPVLQNLEIKIKLKKEKINLIIKNKF